MPTADRCPLTAAPPRVLIAVHGHEPDGWPAAAARAVAAWHGSPLRVLGLLGVPCPPLTCPGPFARRAYAAARAEWAAIEAARLEAPLAALLAALPRDAEVVRRSPVGGDAARTVAAQVRDWCADVVVVGPPAPGLRAWLGAGAVHARILRHAGCAVLVTAPPPVRPAAAPVLAPRVSAAGRHA
jgi:nucleotide-binding universal stress UspA family protein